jgi:hypothetical protein
MAASPALRFATLLFWAALTLLYAAPAAAQTAEELVAARKTFAQGVADQTAKRFEAALEEFRRVAAVKDTANVRFRMASCLDALGRMAEALANYEAAVFIGEGDQAADDAVRASRERAAQLDRMVARLTLVLGMPAPPNLEVRVDDARVDPARLEDPIALDSGHHSVTATAPGVVPFHTGVTLPEGGQASITIELRPLTAGDLHEAPTPTPGESGAGPLPIEPNERRSAPTAGYVALGIGGALAVGSVISVALWASNRATLHRLCGDTQPADNNVHCPPAANRSDVNRAHDAAQVFGNLSIGLGVGAAVAAGVGVWLVVNSASGTPRARASQKGLVVSPMVVPHGGGVVLCAPL